MKKYSGKVLRGGAKRSKRGGAKRSKRGGAKRSKRGGAKRSKRGGGNDDPLFIDLIGMKTKFLKSGEAVKAVQKLAIWLNSKFCQLDKTNCTPTPGEFENPTYSNEISDRALEQQGITLDGQELNNSTGDDYSGYHEVRFDDTRGDDTSYGGLSSGASMHGHIDTDHGYHYDDPAKTGDKMPNPVPPVAGTLVNDPVDKDLIGFMTPPSTPPSTPPTTLLSSKNESGEVSPTEETLKRAREKRDKRVANIRAQTKKPKKPEPTYETGARGDHDDAPLYVANAEFGKLKDMELAIARANAAKEINNMTLDKTGPEVVSSQPYTEVVSNA
jgi:hypothetical protein